MRLNWFISIKYLLWSIAIVTFTSACSDMYPDIQLRIIECAPMPVSRATAVSFVIDGNAYIFGGRDSLGNYCNDMWKYDATTDTWEALGTTPLKGRVNATACVHDGVAYIGLGFNGTYNDSNSYLSDWWRFIPYTNQWEQLSPFPSNETAHAISFVGEHKLYVGYGFKRTYERNMYCYDIETNSWTFIDVHLDRNPLTFPIRSFGGVGAACQGRYFAGTGFRKHSLSWWGEFHTEGKWTKCKDIPNGRTTAACTSTQDFVYVIGGMHWGGVNTTGKVLEDIQQYDPQNNSWRNVGRLPNGGLFNHIAFSIGNQIYVGLGEDENFIINNRLYCIHEK
jgi:N-acetylneuraminic acid mutarotase